MQFPDVARLPNAGSPGSLAGSAAMAGGDQPPLVGALNPATLVFDGGDGKALIADTGKLNLFDTFTFAGWVKRTVDDGGGVIYSSDRMPGPGM